MQGLSLRIPQLLQCSQPAPPAHRQRQAGFCCNMSATCRTQLWLPRQLCAIAGSLRQDCNQQRPWPRRRLPQPCHAEGKSSAEALSNQTAGDGESAERGMKEDEDTDEEEDEPGEVGASSQQVFSSQLTEVQQLYKGQLAKKLKEEKERAKQAELERSREFSVGKYCYERGRYEDSVVALELALNKEGPFSQLGGDIQMWLALAYQACGREEECISTYKTLEDTHPVPRVRRQAANLRYIIEAPKLPVNPDERVQIPMLNEVERKKDGRAQYARAKRTAGVSTERILTLEERFMEEYTPPEWVNNRYVWVALVVFGVGLALFSASL